MNILINAAFEHLRMRRLLHFCLSKCGVYKRAALKRGITVSKIWKKKRGKMKNTRLCKYSETSLQRYHQDRVKVSAIRRFPLYRDSKFLPQSYFLGVLVLCHHKALPAKPPKEMNLWKSLAVDTLFYFLLNFSSL